MAESISDFLMHLGFVAENESFRLEKDIQGKRQVFVIPFRDISGHAVESFSSWMRKNGMGDVFGDREMVSGDICPMSSGDSRIGETPSCKMEKIAKDANGQWQSIEDKRMEPIVVYVKQLTDRLNKWQREILTQNLAVYVDNRGCGKSYVAALYAIFHALQQGNSSVCFLTGGGFSFSNSQIGQLVKKFQLVKTEETKNGKMVTFPNGSTISLYSRFTDIEHPWNNFQYFVSDESVNDWLIHPNPLSSQKRLIAIDSVDWSRSILYKNFPLVWQIFHIPTKRALEDLSYACRVVDAKKDIKSQPKGTSSEIDQIALYEAKEIMILVLDGGTGFIWHRSEFIQREHRAYVKSERDCEFPQWLAKRWMARYPHVKIDIE